MRKSLKILLLVVVMQFLSAPLFCYNILDELSEIGNDFVYNQQWTYLDITYNVEDNFPMEESFSLGTNLVMHLFTVANFNLKFNLHREKDTGLAILGGLSAWYMWGLHLAPVFAEDLKDAEGLMLFAGSPYVTVSQSVTDDLTLFGGAKVTVGYAHLDLRPLDLSDTLKSVSYIKETFVSPAPYLGMLINTGEKSSIGVQVGYEILENRAFSKILWIGESWDFGLGFYPDSALSIQPIVNVRF